MSDIKDLTDIVIKHRDKRKWKQFHNPKDVALSLVLEATELLEHFQWKNPEEITKHIEEKREEIGEEVADTFYYLLLFAYDNNIDIKKAFLNKMKKNEKKYPVSKSKNNHLKYTEHQK